MNSYTINIKSVLEQQKLINDIKFIYSYQKDIYSYIKELKTFKNYHKINKEIQLFNQRRALSTYNKLSKAITDINFYKYYRHYIYKKDSLAFSIELKNIIAQNLELEYGREPTAQEVINFEHKIKNLSKDEFNKIIEEAKANIRENEVNNQKVEIAIKQKNVLIEKLQNLSTISFETVSNIIKTWLKELKFNDSIIKTILQRIKDLFAYGGKVLNLYDLVDRIMDIIRYVQELDFSNLTSIAITIVTCLFCALLPWISQTKEKTKANRQEEENQEQKPKEDNTQKPNQNNKK